MSIRWLSIRHWVIWLDWLYKWSQSVTRCIIATRTLSIEILNKKPIIATVTYKLVSYQATKILYFGLWIISTIWVFFIALKLPVSQSIKYLKYSYNNLYTLHLYLYMAIIWLRCVCISIRLVSKKIGIEKIEKKKSEM